MNGLTQELAQKDMFIEMLRRQLMEKETLIASMEMQQQHQHSSSRGPSSPQTSQQNLRKASIDSMHNLPSPGTSSNSLQNLMQRSPMSSQQNLRSPSGSHQSLVVKQPSRGGGGSQERLLALSDSFTSLSTSGLSTAGTGKSAHFLGRPGYMSTMGHHVQLNKKANVTHHIDTDQLSAKIIYIIK